MEASITRDLEALIFDFEGTLVDFQRKLSEAVEKVLEKTPGNGVYQDTVKQQEIFDPADRSDAGHA